jgi:hypothetical protein
MKRVLFLLVIVLLLVGCATGYRGSGNFGELTRTYIPVIGVTRGYSIEMPVFSPEADISTTYSLQRLPRKNWGFYVDLIVYLPEQRLPYAKQQEINVSVPREHQITCKLVDKKTSRVLFETTETVSDLKPSQAMAFRGSPFVKHLLRAEFSEIPSGAQLEIKMEYKTGGIPLKREMLIVVVNDAPLA